LVLASRVLIAVRAKLVPNGQQQHAGDSDWACALAFRLFRPWITAERAAALARRRTWAVIAVARLRGMLSSAARSRIRGRRRIGLP